VIRFQRLLPQGQRLAVGRFGGWEITFLLQ